MAQKTTWIKTTLVNGGVLGLLLLLCLGGYETYIRMGADNPASHIRMAGSYVDSHRYSVPHEVLGYGPRASQQVDVQKYAGETLLYDVAYTIDKHRLRQMPYTSSQPSTLFFGCSFMFGEGLQDDETLPYYFAQAKDFQVNAYNFGFHGYGPHHMLRALESGYVSEIVDTPVTHAYFESSTWHIYRSAGLSIWDTGPKYVLKHGTLQAAGLFEPPWLYKVMAFQPWSKAIQKIGNQLAHLNPPTADEMIALYIAILEASAKEIKARYDASLTILFWDRPFVHHKTDLTPIMVESLRSAGFDVLLTSQIWPDGIEQPEYAIPVDNHPSALANQLSAQALISHAASSGKTIMPGAHY